MATDNQKIPTEEIIQSGEGIGRLQEHFLGWQCRVREYIFRQDHGRPNAGVRPKVLMENGHVVSKRATLLLLPHEPNNDIIQFQYMVRKTHDPNIRASKAVQYLSSTFYQNPENFNGTLTGLFSKESYLTQMLDDEDICILKFSYQNQQFSLACLVETEESNSEPFQFTTWHNRLFNPNHPQNIAVLSFKPIWQRSTADPPPLAFDSYQASKDIA